MRSRVDRNVRRRRHGDAAAKDDVKWRLLLPVMVVALLGAMVIASSVGAVAIAPYDVAAAIGRKLGVLSGPAQQADAVFFGIRLPRIVLGVVVGGALGTAGAVLQSVFRNPLADPQLVGIGPGAALAAAIGAVVGGANGSLAAGVAGGMLSALVVRRLGRRIAEADPTRLLLAGIALGAVLSAWVGFVVFGSDRSRVPPLEFWLLGSLSGSTWRVATISAVFAIGSGLALWASWRSLDLLVLGRREAGYLGVNVDLVTTTVMLATGALVGVTVGAAGVIGFAGLVGPHVARPLSGPSHRRLIPAAALAGATFVVLADVVARIVLSPIEIPAGLITSALGGPMLLWLIARRSPRTP